MKATKLIVAFYHSLQSLAIYNVVSNSLSLSLSRTLFLFLQALSALWFVKCYNISLTSWLPCWNFVSVCFCMLTRLALAFHKFTFLVQNMFESWILVFQFNKIFTCFHRLHFLFVFENIYWSQCACMHSIQTQTHTLLHTYTHARMEKQIRSIYLTPWILLTLNQLRSGVFSVLFSLLFLEKFQLLCFSTN